LGIRPLGSKPLIRRNLAIRREQLVKIALGIFHREDVAANSQSATVKPVGHVPACRIHARRKAFLDQSDRLWESAHHDGCEMNNSISLFPLRQSQ
jgi:hypothetical protein